MNLKQRFCEICFFFPCPNQIFCIFAMLFLRKTKQQTYWKKGVVLTLYLRLLESSKFQIIRKVKQGQRPCILYYGIAWAKALLILGWWAMLEPRAAGWAIVQTPALLFRCVFRRTNQIWNEFGVLGVGATTKKGNAYAKTIICFYGCIGLIIHGV